MNAERMIHMILRQVMRLVSRRAAGGARGAEGGNRARQTRQTAQAIRKASRIARGVGRF